MQERKRPIKKNCRYCENKISFIDYKDEKDVRRMLTERGKIVPRRMSGTCAKHQRQIARAVKRARFLALVPYVAENIK
ncbi:MAG: 30S ribosomal protein S18 [Syntrophales bacterium LBB04]|nr:30S ribosomal protein S18 [Syntrophales bacterium LBB04]